MQAFIIQTITYLEHIKITTKPTSSKLNFIKHNNLIN